MNGTKFCVYHPEVEVLIGGHCHLCASATTNTTLTPPELSECEANRNEWRSVAEDLACYLHMYCNRKVGNGDLRSQGALARYRALKETLT